MEESDIGTLDQSERSQRLESSLNCGEFEEHIQNLLDARLAPDADAAVQAHLSKCGDCANVLREYLLLEAALRSSLPRSLNRASPAINSAAPLLDAPLLDAESPYVSSLEGKDASLTPAHGAYQSRQQAVAPRHPVSLAHRDKSIRWIQTAVLLILLGTLGLGIIQWRQREATLLPVPSRVAKAFPFRPRPSEAPAAIRPVNHFRSLEQCYSLTTELPGVKPLQTSILVALDWWQDYLGIRYSALPKSNPHEHGFGLNPLLVEGWHRA